MTPLSVQGDLLPGSQLTPDGVDALHLHEAAHAVILDATGGTVKEVLSDVEPTRVQAHVVKGNGWTLPAILAGIAAERVAGLAEFHPADIRREEERLLGWTGDLQHFRALSSGRAGVLRRVLDEAEDLVQSHWDRIRAVADALNDQETLNGDEVRSIVRLARTMAPLTSDDTEATDDEVDGDGREHRVSLSHEDSEA